MDTGGTIYPLTVTLEPQLVSILEVGLRGICIQGVRVSSRERVHELLAFAASKRIIPTVVKYPLTVDGIERAMEDLRNDKVRYRAVLVKEAIDVKA